MLRLAEIQSHFRKAVVDGDTRGVATVLIGGYDPEKRLTVHQRNYQTGLVDSLLVKFPATAWLIGTPFVTEAAKHFAREHPPQAPCIAEYGAAFPDFLAGCPETQRLPYLRKFAQLEWYVGQVSIAVDHAPVTGKDFSIIDAGALPETVLMLQSGLHYIEASWPVDELMKLYLTEKVPDYFELSPADVWIEVRGARGEFQLNRLDAANFTFRKSVLGGRSIGDAAESALDINPGFDPGQALAALIAEGLITVIGRNSTGETS